VKQAAKNTLGISEYHQLVLAPVGGGQWPVIVYCLELPPGFPRGDGLQEDLTVDGLFFKNWSYPYDGGMGLAPVIVTPRLNWIPPRVAPPARQRPANLTGLAMGGAAAMLAALVFVSWVVRQTRRPRQSHQSLPETLALEAEL
jgi:hypothetical protein